MQAEQTGLVLKGIGGFYYVFDGETVHACRARGKFRKARISPYAGDRVRFTPDETGEGCLSEILPRRNFLRKEELPEGFREFEPYLGACKFTSCSHTCEKGCAVLAAVEAGEIPRSRMESYIAMYNEVKDIREWQLSKTKNV